MTPCIQLVSFVQENTHCDVMLNVTVRHMTFGVYSTHDSQTILLSRVALVRRLTGSELWRLSWRRVRRARLLCLLLEINRVTTTSDVRALVAWRQWLRRGVCRGNNNKAQSVAVLGGRAVSSCCPRRAQLFVIERARDVT